MIWPETDNQWVKGRLWLKGRASVLLSEGRWFDSPGLHVKVSLGEILKPQTAPDVLVGTLHSSVYECMWITVSRFGQKLLVNLEKKQHLNGQTN